MTRHTIDHLSATMAGVAAHLSAVPPQRRAQALTLLERFTDIADDDPHPWGTTVGPSSPGTGEACRSPHGHLSRDFSGVAP